MTFNDSATNTLEGVTVLTEPTVERLNQRQQIDYRDQREQCLEWLLDFDKNPERADGYARTTVKNRTHPMYRFYRWVWDRENGYTTAINHDHADAHPKWLAEQDYSNAHKG